MAFKELRCPICGSNDFVEIENNIFYCKSCSRRFQKKSDINEIELEAKISASLGAQELKLYSNAKKNLWIETHKEYLSSENIKKWVYEVRKYSPDDFFAGFYYEANFGEIDSFCNYLLNYINDNNYIFADEVIRYLIKTAENKRLLQILITLLDEAKLEEKLSNEYRNEINELAIKLDDGVFNTNIPRDVFVCYSSKDIAKVSKIVDYLEYNGITCFCAQRNLRHGKGAKEKYIEELKNAMHNSKCILFVSTLNSRDLECDALSVEITYLNKYEPKKPRIEFVIDKNDYDKTKPAAKILLKKYFNGQEFCTDLEDLLERILNYTVYGEAEEENEKMSSLEKHLNEQSEMLKKMMENKANLQSNDNGNGYDPTKFVIKNGVLETYLADEDNVIVPKMVKLIKERAFEEKSLKSIVFNEGLTEIEDEAFMKCENLKEINLPNSLIILGEGAFRECKSLKKIKFSNNLTEIKKNCFFRSTVLKEVVLPASLKMLGNSAFSDCPNLEKIDLNNGLEIIGNYAFSGCDSLDSLSIPASVTSIGGGILHGCEKLFDIVVDKKNKVYESPRNKALIEKDTKRLLVLIPGEDFPKNIKIIGMGAFTYRGYEMFELLIPSSVEEIEEFAFYNTLYLESVILSEGVKIIGSSAFSDCSDLRNIVLPKSLESIEDCAFENCQIREVVYNGSQDDYLNIDFGIEADLSEQVDVVFKESENKYSSNYSSNDNYQSNNSNDNYMSKYDTDSLIRTGYQFLNEGNYDGAIICCGEGIKRGDSTCMYFLGTMYEQGEGLPVDYEKAMILYEGVIKRDDPIGYYAMGNMYLTGHGIPQDLEKAVQYFNVSAQMKCSSGQYWLGICYLKGWGIRRHHA